MIPTSTAPATTPDEGPANATAPGGPPSSSATTQVLVFGHLAWLGWLWLLLLVALTAVLTGVAVADGEMTNSLWAPAGAGWQGWVFLASGVVTATSFLRMFVTRGVSRAQLTRSAFGAVAVLAAIGSAVVSIGFVIEGALFFTRPGWRHELPDGELFGYGDLPRLAVEHGLLFVVYFLSGWLIGAAFGRFGTPGGVALVLPCLVPAALGEVLVDRAVGAGNIEVLGELLGGPPLALGLAGCLAVIGLTAAVVAAVTRRLPVK